MKVTISKGELITHRKHLLIAKPSKKLSEIAQVTLSAAEQLSLTGRGFRHDMNCEAVQWGTVRLANEEFSEDIWIEVQMFNTAL